MTWIETIKSRPVVFICLFFILGILAARVAPSLVIPFSFLIIISSLLFFPGGDGFFGLAFVFTVFFLGWWNMALKLENQNNTVAQIDQYHRQDVRFSGTVREVKRIGNQTRITVDRGTITGPGEKLGVKTGFFLYSRDKFNGEPGDSVWGAGELRKMTGVRNPGEFNFRKFYLRKGLACRIYPETINRRAGQKNTVTRIYAFIRARIRTKLYDAIGAESGLVTALILGDKSQIDPEVKQAFVRTGVVHVLAVSGLHVGFVLLVLLSLARLLRIPWGWDRLFLILGLCFYVGLTGTKASVVRASVMAGLYFLAPVVNRPADVWNILALAALGILVAEPQALQDLGFQLSFVAVISILVIYGQFQRVLPECLKVNQIKNRGLKYVWGLFLVSLAAQLGTLPFIAYYFHRVSVVAFFANILIVPIVGVLLATGFLILFLGWIPIVGPLMGQAAWFLTRLIQTIAHSFSQLEFAAVPVPAIKPFALVVYYLVLAGIFLIGDNRRRRKGIILVLVAANLMVWENAFKKQGWNILFLDVGEGDAAVLTFPDGKAMLIDGGQRTRFRDYGEKTILPLLNFLKVKQVTWMVATHPHNDHIGGLVTITETLPVDTVWEVNSDFTSSTNLRLTQTLVEQGTVIQYPTGGEIKWLSPHSAVEFFNPEPEPYSGDVNVNNRSLVFRLILGKFSVFFPGDLEQGGEVRLLPYGRCLASTVLKVAHHGSESSTTRPFLNRIYPEMAVVSVGEGNKFGHPSPLIMERLKALGIHVHRTDQEGACWIWTDGNKYREITWK